MKSLFTTLTLLTPLALLSSQALALDIAALESAMMNPDRPEADKTRDASRKAPQVLDFMGLEPGMTVVDLIAAGGWYTEVLSYAVGDSGRVLMHNNPGPGLERNAEATADRLSRLDNVETFHAGVTDLQANSLDFAITALNFHDIHNPDPNNAIGLFSQLHAAMKPGGILAVIDHEGTAGADNVSLHRIAFEDAVKALTQAGFALVGVSDILDNPADDHTVGPFDPSLGRNTDRLVLKLVKI